MSEILELFMQHAKHQHVFRESHRRDSGECIFCHQRYTPHKCASNKPCKHKSVMLIEDFLPLERCRPYYECLDCDYTWDI